LDCGSDIMRMMPKKEVEFLFRIPHSEFRI